MKILVPIDGSKNSLEAVSYAVEMAEKYGNSQVTLVYVIMYETYFMDSPTMVESKGEEKAGEAFDEALDMASKISDVEIETLIKKGSSAADNIIDVADEGKYDVIVMGSQGISNLKRFLMGSVSTRVSQYAPCTVVLVR